MVAPSFVTVISPSGEIKILSSPEIISFKAQDYGFTPRPQWSSKYAGNCLRSQDMGLDSIRPVKSSHKVNTSAAANLTDMMADTSFSDPDYRSVSKHGRGGYSLTMMNGLPISSWATTALSSDIWEGTPPDIFEQRWAKEGSSLVVSGANFRDARWFESQPSAGDVSRKFRDQFIRWKTYHMRVSP
jgi:hypothetical protein